MDGTLSFSDLIKKKFLEEMGTGALSINMGRILLSLLLALALGFLIYYVYQKTFMGVVYSRSFGFSLVLTAMVTALVILPITSNLVLSLGMVGALSIVRFRAAIKDPLDIGYLFWAISIGITTGAGFYSLSVVGTLLIAAVVIAYSRIRYNNAQAYLLVVNYDERAQAEVGKVLGELTFKKLNTKTAARGTVEITYHVRVKDGDEAIVQKLAGLEGVTSATLVGYHSDC